MTTKRAPAKKLNSNELYWRCKELLDLLGDALFSGEMHAADIAYMHSALARTGDVIHAVAALATCRRAVRLRALIAEAERMRIVEQVNELKSKLEKNK